MTFPVFGRPSRRLQHRLALTSALVLASLLLSPEARAQITLTDGTITANETVVGDQFGPVTAAAPDGTFAVVWVSEGQDSSFGGVYVRRFDTDGTALDSEQLVNTETVGDQTDPDLTYLEGGGFVVVWDSDGQDGELRGIYGQLFDSAGQKVGGEIAVNATTAGDQNDAVVAPAPGGGFLVAWETQEAKDPFEDLVVRLFDSSGSPVTGEIALNQTTAGDQEDLDLAAAGSGFVAVWESDGEMEDGEAVRARLIGSDGTPVGDEIAVNTFTTGDQDNPDVAARADGSFVVAWQDDSQDTFPQAYFRGFGSDGTPATGEIEVADSVVPHFLPRLDLGPNGGPVIVWITVGQDGSGAGTRIRHYDAAGTPQGEGPQLNVVVTGDQDFPHVATGGGSKGLAVWESEGEDGSGFGVIGRTLQVPLFADGFETGDSTAWDATVP